VPLDVETTGTEELEDHVRHALRIRVSEFSTLPAHLLVPRDLEEGRSRPGIIASHGHVETGMDHIAGLEEGERSYGLWAVRAGYVVLCPAWWGWPGRDGHAPLVGDGRDKCNVIAMAAAMYGMNVAALHLQDAQAALDALVARPEVDADRLAVIGNSYGGRTAMWLAALDERVTACVSSGAMNTFRERSLKLSSCGIQCLPGLLQYGDVPEVFSLIAPRALQLQAGEGDGLITPADRDAIAATVRSAYADLGAEEKFEYVLHPHGHTLSWDHAAPFLKRHL
jgi:dienelactone hydrolase